MVILRVCGRSGVCGLTAWLFMLGGGEDAEYDGREGSRDMTGKNALLVLSMTIRLPPNSGADCPAASKSKYGI